MTTYPGTLAELREHPRTWLVTGAAGFIGSNLTQALLDLGQHVVGLDDLSTGHLRNLAQAVGDHPDRAARFRFVEGSIVDEAACRDACRGVDYVLHHAALCSVSASIADPASVHAVNEGGFVQVMEVARAAGVRRVVYASTSAVYGDRSGGALNEDVIGRPLSPYGLGKRNNEQYACLYRRVYGLESVGLRYFNVFGPRQDPAGAYAAVVPSWTQRLIDGDPCETHGDGLTTRDFCHVDNVVQANLLAATAPLPASSGRVYNVGCGANTTLNDLFDVLRRSVARHVPAAAASRAVHGPFRPGDVRRSQAALSLIRMHLGYRPDVSVSEGLANTVDWYFQQNTGTLSAVG